MYTTYDTMDGLYASEMMANSFVNLISFAINILVIVATCFVYTKLGLAWWKAIIPYYNTYALAERVWDKKNAKIILWLNVGASILAVITLIMLLPIIVASAVDETGASLVGGSMFVMLLSLAILVITIIAFVWEVRMYLCLAKAFGKDGGFAVGIILLAPIFMSILAFGKSNQCVLHPIEDGVQPQNNGYQAQQQPQKSEYQDYQQPQQPQQSQNQVYQQPQQPDKNTPQW